MFYKFHQRKPVDSVNKKNSESLDSSISVKLVFEHAFIPKTYSAGRRMRVKFVLWSFNIILSAHSIVYQLRQLLDNTLLP